MSEKRLQLGSEAGAVEDVVAEDERHGVGSDVIRAEGECRCKAVGFVLDRVREVHAEL